ncbi:MAG: hypothetical protein ACYCSN_17605 [Acidobacteriaceae bacterium]
MAVGKPRSAAQATSSSGSTTAAPAAVVEPEGAEVRARNKRTWQGPTPQVVSDANGAVLWTGDGDHRYTEELILPGESLYALGQFQSLDPLQTSAQDDLRELVVAWKADPKQRAVAEQQVAQARDEQAARPQTHVLRKPPARRIFQLSTLPPDKLVHSLYWQAWTWLAAGLLAFSIAVATMIRN